MSTRIGIESHKLLKGEEMMRGTFFKSLVLMFLAAGVQPTFAQLSPSAAWATHAQNEYQVFANLTYLVASNYEAKLDIYKRRDTTGPQPTLIFIHGGGARRGGGLPLRVAVCGGTGQNVRPGYEPSGTERRIRRRTSGAYHRD